MSPAILLTHSQSGPFGYEIADSRPNLVKAVRRRRTRQTRRFMRTA